jgi:PPM family protein phosphatase
VGHLEGTAGNGRDLLRGVDLLQPLSGERLGRLAEATVRLSFNSGAVIACEGPGCDYFYVVIEGEVELVRYGDRLGVLGPGDHFGEAALLRGVAGDVTVVARTAVLLYAIEGAAFADAVVSNRQSWEAVAKLISERRRFDVDD